MKTQVQYVDDATLAERYGVRRQSVWRWVRTQGFPAPVKFSGRCTRWRLDEVEAWEAQRLAG